MKNLCNMSKKVCVCAASYGCVLPMGVLLSLFRVVANDIKCRLVQGSCRAWPYTTVGNGNCFFHHNVNRFFMCKKRRWKSAVPKQTRNHICIYLYVPCGPKTVNYTSIDPKQFRQYQWENRRSLFPTLIGKRSQRITYSKTLKKASKIAIAKQRRGSLFQNQSKIAGSTRRDKTPVNEKKLSAARKQLGKEGGRKCSEIQSETCKGKGAQNASIFEYDWICIPHGQAKGWLLRNGGFRQLCGPVQSWTCQVKMQKPDRW